MSKYQQFIFQDYRFDPSAKTLVLNYDYDNALQFSEVYTFAFDFVAYDSAVLDRAFQLLFLLAGVSYYKAFLAPEIVVKSSVIDEQLARFLNQTYQRGLGEFFFVNQLNPNTQISFPVTTKESLNKLSVSGEGVLVSIGGGKDSLVSAELLSDQPRIATWSVGHRQQLEPLVAAIGTAHLWVERSWDKQLLDLKENPEAYNGHIPISAIFAAVGTAVAVLSGYRDVVVSNESSASEPNLTYQNVAINHQYSKSLEFEQAYQQQLARLFGEGVRYYSLLRPFTEVRIAELFAKTGYEKYKNLFSSCNRAFVHGSQTMSWCGECPKCAFVFLALTPFLERAELERLFGDKNLLLDPALETMYRQLLGIEGNKPLDCVGEIKESRAAMRLAQKLYPELAKYTFDLPEDYDFRALSPHSMPTDIFATLQSALRRG